jgi:hypothetical protein
VGCRTDQRALGSDDEHRERETRLGLKRLALGFIDEQTAWPQNRIAELSAQASPALIGLWGPHAAAQLLTAGDNPSS